MAVTSLITNIIYNTNGTQQSFAVPFYFIKTSDLVIQSIDASGNLINYRLNIDYTVNGIPDLYGDYNNGANIVFNTPPAASLQLLIQRQTSRDQPVVLLDYAPYSADTINHIMDKLTLIIQEGFVAGYKGAALGPPTSDQISYSVGDWFKNINFVPGGVFGWVCVTAGNPGTWQPSGPISLL